MTGVVEAIYENGILRPLQALDGVAEKARVRVAVETMPCSGAPGLADGVGILCQVRTRRRCWQLSFLDTSYSPAYPGWGYRAGESA